MMNEYLQSAMGFFSTPFFIILGGISTTLVVFTFSFSIFLVFKGVLPVLYRLGMALSKRKVAIFASSDEFSSLRSMLVDSKIFKDKNIIQVHKNDIKKADDVNLFLVYWKEYKDSITEILGVKKDITALVVYAPPNEDPLDDENLMKINSQRNSTVVNFRGRLLNDIFILLITTNYE